MSELHGDARYLVYGGILFAAWGKSATTDASVATGRNGSANTDQRLSPRRIDGESGRLALEGSIAYIVNHAFAKSLFFLVAGALSYSCGTRFVAASAWRIAHPAVARRGFLRGSAGDYRRAAVQRLLQ